jgi:hypothetical protein
MSNDPTYLLQKDRVVGELASRIGVRKPVSSLAGFNKNKHGKKFQKLITSNLMWI